MQGHLIGWIMVKGSDKTWSTGEGNDKPLQYSCLANPNEQYEKAKRYDTERRPPPTSVGAKFATGNEWRNSYRMSEEAESKQKQCPAVDVTSDGSKFQCCKEQYCRGT